MKDKLLKTGLFNDNEYLDKYVELCTSPSNNIELICEKHHIIPRSVTSYLNIDTDDSEDNIVTLDIKNHCLAHYYLVLCSNNGKIKFSNMLCLQLITHREFNNISEQ